MYMNIVVFCSKMRFPLFLTRCVSRCLSLRYLFNTFLPFELFCRHKSFPNISSTMLSTWSVESILQLQMIFEKWKRGREREEHTHILAHTIRTFQTTTNEVEKLLKNFFHRRVEESDREREGIRFMAPVFQLSSNWKSVMYKPFISIRTKCTRSVHERKKGEAKYCSSLVR